MEGASASVDARHKALLDALPDLLLRLRADGTYLEIGGDTSKLANPPNQVVGATTHELLPPDVAERLMQCVRTSLEQGRLATVEYTLRTHLGDEREFEVRAAPSGPDEVVAVVRDVTELRRAMRDLTDSRARIVAAGDAERRRVERNLHDGAQQRLVTVALHLHLVKRRLETDPTEVAKLVDSAQTELTLALEEIRELVRGLHPRLLSDRGLGPALVRSGRARRAARRDRRDAVGTAAAGGRGRRVLPRRRGSRQRGQAQRSLPGARARDHRRGLYGSRGRRRRRRRSGFGDGIGPARPRRPGRGARGELDVVSEAGQGTTLRATLPHDNPHE